MTTHYKLVCDYDGTVDIDGSYREQALDVVSMAETPWDKSGSFFVRSDMPWDSDKVVGSREFRRKNQRLSIDAWVPDEDAQRLLESWLFKFAENWQPSRPWDHIRYKDNSGGPSWDPIGEGPEPSGYARFDDTNDRLYIGSRTQPFTSLDIYMTTLGVGGTFVWEYSDGDDSWNTLTVTGGDWDANGQATWSDPGDWVRATMTEITSTSESMYWVRCRCTGTPSTDPVIMWVKRHRPISAFLMVSSDEVTWTFYRRAVTGDYYYPNGFGIERVERIITPGEPNIYRVALELVEANY